jgi:hypothetical protein
MYPFTRKIQNPNSFCVTLAFQGQPPMLCGSFLSGSTFNPSAFERRASHPTVCSTLSGSLDPPHAAENLIAIRKWSSVFGLYILIISFLIPGIFFKIMFSILAAVVETFVLWRASHSEPRSDSSTELCAFYREVSQVRSHLGCLYTTVVGF